MAGRDFNQTDTPTSPRVAIVNEAFAHKFMGGANPLGRIINDTGKPDQTYQIVGLVKNTKVLPFTRGSHAHRLCLLLHPGKRTARTCRS